MFFCGRPLQEIALALVKSVTDSFQASWERERQKEIKLPTPSREGSSGAGS